MAAVWLRRVGGGNDETVVPSVDVAVLFLVGCCGRGRIVTFDEGRVYGVLKVIVCTGLLGRWLVLANVLLLPVGLRVGVTDGRCVEF